MDESYARLIWVNENGPQTYLLNPGQVVTMGREPGNGIVIPLGSISRKHAKIEWNGSNYVISDLGSTNGTFVNNNRVGQNPVVLRDADRIQLHSLLMRFTVIWSTDDPFGFAPDAREYPAYQTRQRLHQTSTFESPEEKMGDTFISQWFAGEEFMQMPEPCRLVASAGLDAGRTFNLTEPIITIGFAAPGAAWEIQLNDPSVSQPHARLEWMGDEYQLSDLNTTTGTILNGERVSDPVILKEGDVMKLGSVRLVYRGKDSGPAVS